MIETEYPLIEVQINAQKNNLVKAISDYQNCKCGSIVIKMNLSITQRKRYTPNIMDSPYFINTRQRSVRGADQTHVSQSSGIPLA